MIQLRYDAEEKYRNDSINQVKELRAKIIQEENTKFEDKNENTNEEEKKGELEEKMEKIKEEEKKVIEKIKKKQKADIEIYYRLLLY